MSVHQTVSNFLVCPAQEIILVVHWLYTLLSSFRSLIHCNNDYNNNGKKPLKGFNLMGAKACQNRIMNHFKNRDSRGLSSEKWDCRGIRVKMPFSKCAALWRSRFPSLTDTV